MVALFESTTGGTDWENLYEVISNAGPFYQIMYLFFIAFFVIAAWNIVTSTFVEKILKLAIPDIETLIKDKRKKDMKSARELMSILAFKLEGSDDSLITIDQFRTMFSDQKFRAFFAVRGLDLRDAEVFFDMLRTICDENNAVDIKTFVGACLRLQGLATSLDLQTLHFDMKNMMLNQLEMLYTLLERTEESNDVSPQSAASLAKSKSTVGTASLSSANATAGKSSPSLNRKPVVQISLTPCSIDVPWTDEILSPDSDAGRQNNEVESNALADIRGRFDL
jgi:hypothetical protein